MTPAPHSTMRAAVLHGREDLRIENVACPVAGPGEVVLRVEAALTCGTDLKVFRRGYHAKMLTVDRLFGHELAGVIVELGEGVEDFAMGDRVVPLNSAPCDECFYCLAGQQNLCDDLLFNNGAYAEFVRVPARIVSKNMLRVPTAMPMEHAALVEPLACVMRGMEQCAVKAGQTVIVLGAGPIGLLFIHAASLAGLHVIAVVKRTDQVATAKSFGAEQVVRLADVEDPIAAARALTPEGRGADVVFEAVATPEAWQWAVQMVRKGGLVNLFGGPPAGTTASFDTNLLHYSDINIKASFHHTPSTARAAFELLCSGDFEADKFLTGTAELEEVPSVFNAMLTRPAEGIAPEIKTVIYPRTATERLLADEEKAVA
ncbi:zinc-binding dehydrogenase [Granulicella cerasi]|uniref:Zinc-binding dehydrogenase n=1 Tax=Granulicella cerasi TaxID=741063 RepID=A0ABW1Z6R3_9BACT|nr:zinc-binding dehydrogenase [Granulicella cerasi]